MAPKFYYFPVTNKFMKRMFVPYPSLPSLNPFINGVTHLSLGSEVILLIQAPPWATQEIIFRIGSFPHLPLLPNVITEHLPT